MQKNQHLIILGGEKCGSTWLQHLFDTNRQFHLYPLEQETEFFTQSYSKGYDYYESLFQGKENGQITVDACPAYFSKPFACDRISDYIQHTGKRVRFILSIREPLSRIESAYKMIIRRDGFKPFRSEMETGSYIENSLYAKHLNRYLELFAREDFCLLLYDDIVANPQGVANRLESFIGLNSGQLSLVYEGTRINAGGLRRSPLISGGLRLGGRTLRRLGLIDALHRVKRSQVVGHIQSFNSIRYDLPEKDRNYLEGMRHLFASDVKEIAAQLGRPEIVEKWGYAD